MLSDSKEWNGPLERFRRQGIAAGSNGPSVDLIGLWERISHSQLNGASNDIQRSTYPTQSSLDWTLKMLSRSITKLPALAARRGFHSSATRLSSPYHYPEGPYSNIPFNPRARGFAIKYWGFMAVGFGLPFGIAVWQTKKNK